METNNNKFNNDRNKFNQVKINNPNYHFNKRNKKFNQQMPHGQAQNLNYIPNQEYSSPPPYLLPNMYPIQMPNVPNKEAFMKNSFKMFQYNQNYPYMQYPYPNNMGVLEKEMSMEDNAHIGFPKNIKRKNNIPLPNNKEIMQINPNINKKIANETNTDENNINNIYNNENMPIPDYYNYDNDYNYYYNPMVPKFGKKKWIIEGKNNKNKFKKNFYKKEKKKFAEQYNEINNINNINKNEIYLPAYNNRKPFINKKIIQNNDGLSASSELDNNNYSMEEEEKEENDNKEKNDDQNSDDIIILDNSSKEVLDPLKIKLVEKKNILENNTSNNNKIKIIPELDKMCSEKEIEERDKIKDIDNLEIDADAFPAKKAMKERMVQKYKWKYNKILNLNDPKELRTIKAINQSIEYLINQCLDCDVTKNIGPSEFDLTPQDIIPFIYDRFLAIKETIKLLYENDKTILNDRDLLVNICKMIRTVIIFFNLCLDEFDESSQDEINNYINNLLMTLLEIIMDVINNESDYEYNLNKDSKDEFLSYYLFIKIKKERNNFQKYYDEIKSKLNNDQIYNKIELVNEVYLSLKNKDYERFINILKKEENCDYFFVCFMSLFFKEICVYGLQKISLKKKELTYKEIKDLLTFEDIDEVKNFLIWYGITKDKGKHIINESDIVPIIIKNPNKKFDYEKAPQLTNKKFVEKKKDNKLRKDEVNKNIDIIKNENYKTEAIEDIKDNQIEINKEKPLLKNESIILSDISRDKSEPKQENKINISTSIISSIKKEDIKPIIPFDNKKIISNPIINKPIKIDESFMSKGSYKNLFNSSNSDINNLTPKTKEKEDLKNKNSSDDFLKPYSPKIKSFDSPNKNNKSLDVFSHDSISSIEPPKNYPNFNEQTMGFFCEVSNSYIDKIISERKLDFIFRLKFLSEKYKIKLDLIENYINRRKFFVFNELKKCCLDKKYSREYFNEIINYKNDINSENTNENTAFKIENKNIAINKKFELLTYEDIIYFLVNNYQNMNLNNNEQKGYINHLQINIYTTKDLIKTTKLLSGLKINKNLIKENEDGTELSIINPNINIDSINTKITFIIKFIFVDQIIDLESYICENQENIQKYSILIPFFDVIKSDPENQQILTKFFIILDLSLGDFIKKDIIFFFVKRDIEPSSDIYKDYQNIQNDFIFNLMKKYSNNNQKNNMINIDDNYNKNYDMKKRVIYLSPIDEFGKCYQDYIKYLNNKAFVELFENNKIMHFNTFNPKEVLIPFSKHIINLDSMINHFINIIEEDLKQYLKENNKMKYFFNKRLCIEILIGFVMCKILLIYYQNKCLVFANELYKIPFYHSNSELLLLESNLLRVGTILRKINLEGYDCVWEKCMNLNEDKIKDLFTYFDIFSSMICSYHLIPDDDIQKYEYVFRKQYYDIDISEKDYQLAKYFFNFFNKIMSKIFENNNINIRLDNTEEIIQKIYDKNKKFLISTIAKIILNNDSLIFNENIIYIQGIEKFYLELKNQEMNELHNNLNKKRKRKSHIITSINNINNTNNINNKKNLLKINKVQKIKENKNQILNNVININESIDRSKDISNSFIFKDIGDMNDDYYKYFRTVKKCTLPDGLI